MALDIVILAAGKGTRMKSALPKVLHRLRGSPAAAACAGHCATLNAQRTVIVTGYAAGRRRALRRPRDVRCVRQEPQLGTGHAVQQAAPLLDDDGTTLILNGDVPLISADTARASDRRPAMARGLRC